MKKAAAYLIITALSVITIQAQGRSTKKPTAQFSETQISEMENRIRRASDELVTAARDHKKSLERLLVFQTAEKATERVAETQKQIAECEQIINAQQAADFRALAIQSLKEQKRQKLTRKKLDAYIILIIVGKIKVLD